MGGWVGGRVAGNPSVTYPVTVKSGSVASAAIQTDSAVAPSVDLITTENKLNARRKESLQPFATCTACGSTLWSRGKPRWSSIQQRSYHVTKALETK